MWRVKNWKTREWRYYCTYEAARAACGVLDIMRRVTCEDEK